MKSVGWYLIGLLSALIVGMVPTMHTRRLARRQRAEAVRTYRQLVDAARPRPGRSQPRQPIQPASVRVQSPSPEQFIPPPPRSNGQMPGAGGWRVDGQGNAVWTPL